MQRKSFNMVHIWGLFWCIEKYGIKMESNEFLKKIIGETFAQCFLIIHTFSSCTFFRQKFKVKVIKAKKKIRAFVPNISYAKMIEK